MVTLNFETFPKMTVQDGLKARLEVVNPMAEKQKAKGLVLMMTKSGEICGSTQISSKMSNGSPASPNSKASHVTSFPSPHIMMLWL